MYRKLSEIERQKWRVMFKKNSIYSILYTSLWRQRGEDLSPEEVWIEGNNLADSLKKAEGDDVEMIVQEAFDDLCQRYSIFVIDDDHQKRRNKVEADHSAMMVTFTAFLLLLNVYPDKNGHPYTSLCKSLADVCRDIKGFTELYEGARQKEDERESKGEFIEVADFIEQIAYQDEPITDKQAKLLSKALSDFVNENQYCDLATMKENERLLSRANDKNEHCIQAEVDILRDLIKNKKVGEGQQRIYRNIIFASEYKDKVANIRRAIYPFIKDGKYHIDSKVQKEWLAIIEPLKIIDGLLVKHENRKVHKECTDKEICMQLKEYFEEDFTSLNFENIPKSISEERKHWRERGVGLSFKDWNKYINKGHTEKKYETLAAIARSVYGEILKAIRG